MNKLEKWLWSNCELKDNGRTSNSLYFKLGALEIRYSDHIAKTSSGDVQIICSSVYSSTNYVLLVSETTKIMITNASNIIDIIKHMSIIKELRSPNVVKTTNSAKEQNRLILPETLFRPYTINDKNVNKIFLKREEYWSNSEIKALKTAISQYFKQTLGINSTYLRYLKENRVSFNQAINLYKTIVFDNKLTFTTDLLSNVHKYLKNKDLAAVPKINLNDHTISTLG